MVTIDAGQAITSANVALASLQASDFAFVCTLTVKRDDRTGQVTCRTESSGPTGVEHAF